MSTIVDGNAWLLLRSRNFSSSGTTSFTYSWSVKTSVSFSHVPASKMAMPSQVVVGKPISFSLPIVLSSL